MSRTLSSPKTPLASAEVRRYKQSVMDSLATLPGQYPGGTILSCPSVACGVRLYRLCEAASFVEVVLQDKQLLVPINAAIPARSVWDALACPLCGTALTQDGRLHTASRGWW